ncbi:hypothetical protein AB0M28_28390 [Streptomyces sp. NPDC051940]|uniref:hypothetical protein n=1 Tax=Streptomyces sp. NPDC051940 TaxID=3155675 RepID=UPI00343920DD
MYVPRRTASVLVTLLACGTVGGTAAPPASGAGDDGSPPVAVQVRNPDRELSSGADTTYTITVRNRTGEPLPRTVVTQLLPSPLRHVASYPAARVHDREVVWRLPLPPHGTRTLTMKGRLGRIAERDLSTDRTVESAATDGKPGGNPRLSTTVCVRAADRGQLLTCSTTSAPVNRAFWKGNRAFMAISAAAALLVGTVGVILLRRRRPPS